MLSAYHSFAIMNQSAEAANRRTRRPWEATLSAFCEAWGCRPRAEKARGSPRALAVATDGGPSPAENFLFESGIEPL